MNRIIILYGLIIGLFVLSATAVMGEDRTFRLYCKDLEAAAYYAEAMSREDADELNMILDARLCMFFTFDATGEVKERHVLGETGYVAEFIDFDNGLKTITVSPETY